MRYIIGSIVELFGIIILGMSILLFEIGVFLRRTSAYLEKIADVINVAANKIAGEQNR